MATETPQITIYQVGLHILDGGSIEWIAERASLSNAEVIDAWQSCLKRLASALGIAADDPDQVEIAVRDEPEASLRLLLHWQEQTLLQDHVAALSKPDDQGELFSEDVSDD